MAKWTLAPVQDMFKWYLSLATPTRPSNWYLGLSSTTANPTGTWTELTVTNYSRKLITWTYATDGSISASNNADISFLALGAGTVLGQGIWTAITGGTLLAWSDLSTAITFSAGYNLTYGANKLVLSMAI